MNPRISELIDLLNLEPHLGGGALRQFFQAPHLIYLPGCQEARRAMTAAYYLLASGEFDCWHRLAGDEVWNYCEGAPLELFQIKPGEEKFTRKLLGKIGDESRPVAVVPGGYWQMARTTGEYTLVVCTMGPGFEFEDYQQLKDHPEAANTVRDRFPELAAYI